jgi:hypothetical protein
MGFFWDLIQQREIDQQADKSTTLEARVAVLEAEVWKTRELLRVVIERLEKHVGADLNQDGRIG